MPGAWWEMRVSVACLASQAQPEVSVRKQTRPARRTQALQVRDKLWLHPRERRVLPVDVFPEVFPDVLGHFEEYFDDLRIELSSGPEFDFLAGNLK
jgi:hypothetical protein